MIPFPPTRPGTIVAKFRGRFNPADMDHWSRWFELCCLHGVLFESYNPDTDITMIAVADRGYEVPKVGQINSTAKALHQRRVRNAMTAKLMTEVRINNPKLARRSRHGT